MELWDDRGVLATFRSVFVFGVGLAKTSRTANAAGQVIRGVCSFVPLPWDKRVWFLVPRMDRVR